jgi:Patatin-like phospholipase
VTTGSKGRRPEAEAPRNFRATLAEELRSFDVAAQADGSDAVERAEEARLTGLAFSGGGIRSATFNLGILQALGELRILQAFDYLSTVSGGGYIGSWFTALVHREGGDVRVVEELVATESPSGAPCPDHPAVRYLRDYSNYLTPRRGLLSGDTWAAIATYLRNFDLNLLCLVFGLAFPLLAVRAFVPLAGQVALFAGPWMLVASWILTLVTALGIAASLPGAAGRRTGDPSGALVVATAVAVLAMLASITLSSYIFFAPRTCTDPTGLACNGLEYAKLQRSEWIKLGVLLYYPHWVLGWFIYSRRRGPSSTVVSGDSTRRFQRLVLSLVVTALAGVVSGVLLAMFASFTNWIVPVQDPIWAGNAVDDLDPVGKWWAVGPGAGAMLFVVFCGTVVVHIGLMGRMWTDADREWWARLGGWLTAAALGWAAFCAVVMFAPVFFLWARGWLIAAGGASWIATSVLGVLLGRGQFGGAEAGKVRAWVVKIAPIVFVAGALILLSYGIHLALLMLDHRALPQFNDNVGWRQAVMPTLLAVSIVPVQKVLLAAAAAAVIALVLSWRVDVNVFSLYAFYRDRLIRCYLGASNAATGKRAAHGFTGFDPSDDLPFAGIRATQRPLHIVNTAINLVHGTELAWQTRKAASFTFTPLACGFELPPHSPGQAGGTGCNGAYRPTREYMRGITLGSAIAISGAALSPSMGSHTSSGVAFLLTVFDVRLGRWCGNPCHPATWRRFGPTLGGRYLVAEMFGLTDRDSPYVYLSDGGHFENLGIYELVRRRCNTVVAIDAGCDPGYDFTDLAEAIRKCYADFGVVIDIDVSAIRPAEGGRYVRSHHAVGTIRYPLHDGRAPFVGTLLYIKASLTGSEPPDLMNYALEEGGFPHQSTADQFFDEPQFESYRKLGHHVGRAVLRGAVARLRERGMSPDRATLAELVADAASTPAARSG